MINFRVLLFLILLSKAQSYNPACAFEYVSSCTGKQDFEGFCAEAYEKKSKILDVPVIDNYRGSSASTDDLNEISLFEIVNNYYDISSISTYDFRGIKKKLEIKLDDNWTINLKNFSNLDGRARVLRSLFKLYAGTSEEGDKVVCGRANDIVKHKGSGLFWVLYWHGSASCSSQPYSFAGTPLPITDCTFEVDEVSRSIGDDRTGCYNYVMCRGGNKLTTPYRKEGYKPKLYNTTGDYTGCECQSGSCHDVTTTFTAFDDWFEAAPKVNYSYVFYNNIRPRFIDGYKDEDIPTVFKQTIAKDSQAGVSNMRSKVKSLLENRPGLSSFEITQAIINSAEKRDCAKLSLMPVIQTWQGRALLSAEGEEHHGGEQVESQDPVKEGNTIKKYYLDVWLLVICCVLLAMVISETIIILCIKFKGRPKSLIKGR